MPVINSFAWTTNLFYSWEYAWIDEKALKGTSKLLILYIKNIFGGDWIQQDKLKASWYVHTFSKRKSWLPIKDSGLHHPSRISRQIHLLWCNICYTTFVGRETLFLFFLGSKTLLPLMSRKIRVYVNVVSILHGAL